MRREGIHTIEGTITCLSGLRVGGTEDQLEIGGLDLPVIKHPGSHAPYIPGSSLKGRMRSELEHQLGKYSGRDGNEPCGCCKPDCPVCRVFGPHKFDPRSGGKEHPGPSRVLVRDAQVDGPVEIEYKTESVNNRATGQAEHPRQLERVAAGAKFSLRMTLQEYDTDNHFQYAGKKGLEGLKAVVRDCLKYVERTGIGGGLSRGSGEVKIDGLKFDGQPWQ